MLLKGDAAHLPFANDTFDLVFTSPNYMDARTYGIDGRRNCLQWIDWMLPIVGEAVRVSKGLALFVVGGVTRKWCYWPGCEGLLYEWWKRGGRCWRPAYWHKRGIPGSGGKQWLRQDVEYVLAFTKCTGPIPHTDNTAMGHAPKFRPGGAMSHRTPNGGRVKGTRLGRGMANGIPGSTKGSCVGRKTCISRTGPDGDIRTEIAYLPPEKANPGNLIHTKVGGGHLGSKHAHENEAPFPEVLAEFFLKTLVPPGGKVLDPFSGSATTVAVAQRLGMIGVGVDIRDSQILLGQRRLGVWQNPDSLPIQTADEKSSGIVTM